ncbi:AAA family ATPase [Brachybacterium paraconglomeratum]
MPRIRQLEVCDLFGYQDRTVLFQEDGPTIFTGPNGSGKTQTLRLIEAMLCLNLSQLIRLPFGSALLTLDDGTELSAKRNESADTIELTVTNSKARVSDKEVVLANDIEEVERERLSLISRLESTGKDSYYWNGHRHTFESVRRIHAQSVDLVIPRRRRRGNAGRFDTLPGFMMGIATSWPKVPCSVIDTRRLDSNDLATRPEHYISNQGTLVRRPASRIEGYLLQIGEQMDLARRRAIRENQNSDSSFAARALDAAHDAVNESNLRNAYAALVARSEKLASNELHFGASPPPLRETKMNPTEKRILSVFLDDWRKRIEPLEPVNEKIVLFRNLIDGKLNSSYKSTRSTSSGMQIVDTYGDKIDVSLLSSGEQHLVALFTRLLFDTDEGSVVLIDEPEISLHPAWQHEFIDDLAQIQEKTHAQWVIATHSPSIVNSHWDLEAPLRVERPPRRTKVAESSTRGSVDDMEIDLDDLNFDA